VITDFVSITGEGVRGQLIGESVALGNKKLMEAAGIDLSAVAADADRLRDEGATVMFVSRGSTLLGLIAVADSVKVSTPTALQDAHSERSRTQARRTETRRRPALGRPSVGVHGLPVRASM
jgi:Cu+-exporting ATPase